MTLVLVGESSLLLCVCLYFFVVAPRRRRKPLLLAVQLMESDERDALERAERLLNGALAAGLGRRDRSDAQFALAFVRTMLGRYEPGKYREAAASIADARAANGDDTDSVYLELWLRGKLGDDDAVIKLDEHHGDQLRGRPQVTRITSTALLRKAHEHRRRGEIDGAVHYFGLVHDLEVLRDELPPQWRDLHIAHGVRAVFDGRLEEARQSFKTHREAQPSNDFALKSRLGLIICDWKNDEVEKADAELGEVLDRLESAADVNLDDDERALLCRKVALLHLVSLLRSWMVRLPGGQGLPLPEHQLFWHRAERASRSDPELGETMLVHGLIDYFLADDDKGRARAIGVLELGTRTASGITLPEALELIIRNRDHGHRVIDERVPFMAVVKSYVRDGSAPTYLRERLKRQFGHSLLLDDEAGTPLMSRPEPASIEEIRHRAAVLRARTSGLVGPDGATSAEVANSLTEHLAVFDRAESAFVASVNQLHQAEHDLITQTGELLLPDEVSDDGGAHG